MDFAVSKERHQLNKFSLKFCLINRSKEIRDGQVNKMDIFPFLLYTVTIQMTTITISDISLFF